MNILPNCVDQLLFTTERDLLTVCNFDNKDYSSKLGVYPLTRAAMELMSILEYSSNHDFFIRISEKVHSDLFPNTKMTIFEITEKNDEQIFFNKKNPLNVFSPR